MNSPAVISVSRYLVILLTALIAGAEWGSAQCTSPYTLPKFQAAIAECKLQAPNSSAAATQQDLINGYCSNWFELLATDKMAFYQTGDSQRSELRYLNNWFVNTANRTAHANVQIISQTCDQVTFMQIHDDANAGSGPNKPLLRIYRHLAKTPTNHIWAAIKTDSGGSNTEHVDLGLTPTGYFDCDVTINQGSMQIAINGTTLVTRDVSFWTFPSYWKAGAYLQDSGEAAVYFNELTWPETNTQYALTTNTVGLGTVSLNPPGGTYPENTLVQATVTPDTGWQFDGWSDDLTGTQNPETITMDANKAVTATFSMTSEQQTVAGVSASSSQASNVPANTLDGLLGTRWSAEGLGEWIRYDLGAVVNVTFLEIAWHSGTTRTATFNIEVSDDDSNWTPVATGLVSSGTTNALEHVDVPDTLARYVRIVGYGNSSNDWNSITETEIWRMAGAAPDVPDGLALTPANGQVAVVWDSSPGATSYNLKRSTVSGSGYTTIASLSGASHVDTGVINGTTYHYVVSAENAVGASAASSEACAKPHAPLAPEELILPPINMSGTTVQFTVPSVTGRVYQLQRTDDLSPADWVNIGTTVNGTGADVIFQDSETSGFPRRFYRLAITP